MYEKSTSENRNLKSFVLVFLAFILSLNVLKAQIEGNNMPSLSTPSPAEASKLDVGKYVGDVNIFSGNYQNNIELGSVSTPGGLSYSVNLSYNSKNMVSNNPEHLGGIPFGNGWDVSVPSISIKSEAKSAGVKKYNSYQWNIKKENLKNSDLYPDGNSYYYYPYLNIPGFASGRLVLKEQVNNRSVFVLEKFEKYVQAEFYNGIWDVILEDGTVFTFDYMKNNMRNATNNRLDRWKNKLIELNESQFDTTIVMDTMCLEMDYTIFPPVCTKDSIYPRYRFVKRFETNFVDTKNDINKDLAKTIRPIVERTSWYPSQMYNPRLTHQMIYFQYETFGKINFQQEYLQNNFQYFFLEYVIDSLFHMYSNSVDSFFQFQSSIPDMSNVLPYMKSYRDFNQLGFIGNKSHRAGTVFRDIFLKSVIAADQSNGYVPIEKLELNYETFDVAAYSGRNNSFNLGLANLLLWKNNNLVKRFDSLYSIAPVYHQGVAQDPNFMYSGNSVTVPFGSGQSNGNWTRYRHLRSDEFLRMNMGLTGVTNSSVLYNSNVLDQWTFNGTFSKYASTIIDKRNPYAAYYAGKNYYLGREKISSNAQNIPFDHSFIESDRIDVNMVPGDIYEIRTRLFSPNQFVVNYDIDIVTGKNHQLPSTTTLNKNQIQINATNIYNNLNSDYLNPEIVGAQNKSHSIFNTYNNIVKWGSGWTANSSNLIYTSNNFVLPNLPNNYDGFHVRIGPAASDQYNNFGLIDEEWQKLKDTSSASGFIGDFGNFITYYSHYRNQKLGSTSITSSGSTYFNNWTNKTIYDHADNPDNGHLRLWDTDPIPNNFGNGAPWYMIDRSEVAGWSTNVYLNNQAEDYPHHRNWWNNFPLANLYCSQTGVPFGNFPNKPTLADENTGLQGFQINRIAKNPYVLKSVKKYKLSGNYDYLAEYLNAPIWDDHLVAVKEFDYDILQLQIPNNQFDNSSGFRTYANGGQYVRNIFVLSEIRDVNRTDSLDYIATQFEYDTVLEISHQVHCANFFNTCPNEFKTVRLGNVILLNKITDALGGETIIEYQDDASSIVSNGTATAVDFSRFQRQAHEDDRYLQDLPPNIVKEVVFPVSRIGKKNESGNYQYCDYEFENLITDNGMTANEVWKVMAVNPANRFDRSIQGFAKATVYLPPLNPNTPNNRSRIEYEHFGGGPTTTFLNEIPDNHPYLLLGKVKNKKEFDENGKIVKEQIYHYKATKAYANYGHRRKIRIDPAFGSYTTCLSSSYGGNYKPGDQASAYGDYLDLNAIKDGGVIDNGVHVAQLLSPTIADIKVSPFDNQRFIDAHYAPGSYSYFIRIVKEETLDYYKVEVNAQHSTIPGSNTLARGASQNNSERIISGAGEGYIHSAKEYFYYEADIYGKSASEQYKKLLRRGYWNDSSSRVFLSDELDFWINAGGQGIVFNNPDFSLKYRKNKSYQPSWQISAVKTYSDDYPGAYTLQEKYYLFDLQKLYRYKKFYGTDPCGPGNSIPLGPKFTHKLDDEAHAVKFDFDNIIRNSVFQTVSTSFRPGMPSTKVYEFNLYDDYKSGIISINTDETDSVYQIIPNAFCDVLEPKNPNGNFNRQRPDYLLNASELRQTASINATYEAFKKDGIWEEYLWKEKNLKPRDLISKGEVLDNVYQNVNVLKSAFIAYDTLPIYLNHQYSDHNPGLNVNEEFLFYEYALINDSVARPKIRHFPDGTWEYYDSMIAVTYNKFVPRLPYPTIKYADIVGRNRFGQVMIMKDINELTTLLTFPKRGYTWIIDPTKYVNRYNWVNDSSAAGGYYFKDSIHCAYRVMNFGRFGVPDSKTVGYRRPDSLYTTYKYNDQYQLIRSKDPNGMISEFDFDGFGRLIKSKLNSELIGSNEYNYWNSSGAQNKSQNFLDRANENYVNTYTYNSASSAVVSRSHIDPLGREFHSASNHFDFHSNQYTENTVHSGSIDYDTWARPMKSYKPFLGTYQDLDIEQDYSGYHTESEQESSSRGLTLRSADFGEDINGENVVEMDYELISRTTLKTELGCSNSMINNISPSSVQIFKKTSLKDQDGKESFVYENALGQKVAQMVPLTSTRKINTYYVYDAAGNLHKSINDKGQTRIYHYNTLGLMYKSTDPDAGTTLTWFNKKGNIEFIQDANLRNEGSKGHIREFVYDPFGRIIEQNKIALTASINSNMVYSSNKKTFSDEVLDQVIKLENLRKKEKCFEYGKPLTVNGKVRDEVFDEYLCGQYSNGQLSRTESYHENGQLTEINFYFYNKKGQKRSYVSQFNPDGITSLSAGILNRVFYEYDRQSRLIQKIIDLGSDDVIDFNYKLNYDVMGRLSSVEGGLVKDLDHNHELVHFDYDEAKGQLLRQDYLFHDSKSTKVKIDSLYYTYDPKRERLTKLKSNLMDYQLYYDDDTVAFQDYINFPANAIPYPKDDYLSYSNNYNGNINAIQFTMKNPEVHYKSFYGYEYDQANRLINADALIVSEIFSKDAPTSYDLGVTSRFNIGDVEYQYDDIGNMIYKKTGNWGASNNTVDYEENVVTYVNGHNKFSTVNGDQNAFIYDSNGNVKTDNLRNIQMQYGRANLPISLVNNGSTTQYHYGVSDSRIYKQGDNSQAGNNEYYFRDESGTILAILHENNSNLAGPTWQHQLYANSRFATFRPKNSQVYQFRGYNIPATRAMANAGGIILNNDPIFLNNSNFDRKLLYDSLILGGGNVEISNFNLCNEDAPIGCLDFTFESQRLEVNGGKIILKSNTILKAMDGFKINLKPIYIVTRDCILDSDSLNSYKNDSIESMKFYQQDHLGNTRIAYDIHHFDGQYSLELTNAMEYYPFGKILREYNLDTEKFKFTGKERDAESGYDYFEARLYDSDFGRFLQVDPLGGKRESINSYNYVQNNPIMRIDPTGALDGDYYDTDGNHLGNDGIDDDKVYTVEGASKFSIGNFQEGGKYHNNQDGFASDNGTGYSVNFEGNVAETKVTFEGDVNQNNCNQADGYLNLIQVLDNGKEFTKQSIKSIGGPYGNGAPPNGNYTIDNARLRTEAGFTRDEFGFSLDMNPTFQTNRSLLRIHPDGNAVGTLGCVGLQCGERQSRSFYSNVSSVIAKNGALNMNININGNANNHGGGTIPDINEYRNEIHNKQLVYSIYGIIVLWESF